MVRTANFEGERGRRSLFLDFRPWPLPSDDEEEVSVDSLTGDNSTLIAVVVVVVAVLDVAGKSDEEGLVLVVVVEVSGCL